MLRETYTKVNDKRYDKLVEACRKLLDEDILNDLAAKIRRYPNDAVVTWISEFFPEILEIIEKDDECQS